MPGKWKLSAGGASAQQKADRLRMRSDKLARQASAWESGAEREPLVRRKLADLPPEYTVLHDLMLPDEQVRLDHLVLSGGGLYLVDAKKYSGRLVYSKKMLWHGRFPIVDKLETLAWEAETLSDLLGHDVVPVMCFVDAVLPQPVTTLGSVIVCRASVLLTVVRSTHATMTANELSRILDAAQTLRTPRASSGNEWPANADDVTAELGRDADLIAAGRGDLDASIPSAAGELSDESGPMQAISTIPPIARINSADRPEREPRARRWPRRLRFTIVAVVGVAGVSAIVWSASRKSEKSAIEAEKSLPATTATPTIAPTTTLPATTTTLDLQAAGFSVYCPGPGQGWSLRPVWPGTLPDLAWYDYSFYDFDATWKQFALMTSPDTTAYTPTAIPAGNERRIRILPVFKDGTVGEAVVTTWTAPDSAC